MGGARGATQSGARRSSSVQACTILCGCAFLGIKYGRVPQRRIIEHALCSANRFDPCVSSGDNELITKLNECHGTKSSVKWNFGTAKPDSGCFGPDVDQDPVADGVPDWSCKVAEVQAREDTSPRVKVPASGSAAETTKGRSIKIQELAAARDIEDNSARGRSNLEPKARSAGSRDQSRRSSRAAISSYQPAVCKQGVGVLVALR